MPSATFFLTFLRTRCAAAVWCGVGFLAINASCRWVGSGLGRSRRGFLERHARLAWPLARTRIGAGALAAHRQALPMPHAAVAAQLDQSLDRQLNLTPQVALDADAADRFANALELAVR